MRYIGGTLKQRRRAGVGAKVQWRKNRGAWYLIVHTHRDRTVRRFGPTLADKRRAEKAADEINHRLALGLYDPSRPERQPIPFARFTENWLRREVIMPTERELGAHLAPGTARSYASHVRVHLIPHFQERDIRSLDARQVQAFYDQCIDRGRPPSLRSIEMVIATLSLILSHARSTAGLGTNAVEDWKRKRKSRGRRRSAAAYSITPDMVLSSQELEQLLSTAELHFSEHYPLVLFLAHTGTRLGEALALRWSDIDLNANTSCITRSFSSGRHLGPTKTGQVRTVELSSDLRQVLAATRPDLCPQDALAFPNDVGGLIDETNFRRRVFDRLVRRALGATARRITPHTLRHTWCSLHLSRGTNLLWVQQQGGWKSAQTLLQHYTHFIPSELQGYADVIASRDGTRRHQDERHTQQGLRGGAKRQATPRPSLVSARGIEPRTGGLRVRCSTS